MGRKMYLSRTNKIIAGVCGGIAEYFNVDPTLIRVLFVLLLLISRFSLIVIYILCWAIMPLPPEY
ncbi:PspC domain-containing protein [Tyzzerella sp. OttesenSCG-928-J15]|nr:PspC domain-containing protein [Tyzzerella sp. OttesenSCG-928-J15]